MEFIFTLGELKDTVKAIFSQFYLYVYLCVCVRTMEKSYLL